MDTSGGDPYDLFFTGKDDIRDGCIMIGHVGQNNRPVYYQFETPEMGGQETRTTVYRDGHQAVAYFTWTMGFHLGMVTVGQKQIPMTYLVMKGSVAGARMFTAANGNRYEWRKVADDPLAYDLYAGPTKCIGEFRRLAKSTPIGPSYALLQYTFDDDSLMLYALLALSLNRWIDIRGP
ncbi:hypothetical protein ABKN59_003087 [Abortiporus biennis]